MTNTYNIELYAINAVTYLYTGQYLTNRQETEYKD